MNGKDLFNLQEIEDLPEKTKKNLRFKRQLKKRILELFDFKRILSLNEIVVGLYRLHKVEAERTVVITALKNLIKCNHIKPIPGQCGSYERVTNRKEI